MANLRLISTVKISVANDRVELLLQTADGAPVGKFNSPKWRLETARLGFVDARRSHRFQFNLRPLHRGYRRRTGTKNGIESLDLSGVQVTAEDVALLHKQHQKSFVGWWVVA